MEELGILFFCMLFPAFVFFFLVFIVSQKRQEGVTQ